MRLLVGWLNADDPDDALETIDAITNRTGATIQAFDARYVVNETHLERSVELADRAFDRGEAIADDRSVEILLYAAGRRQINRAMRMGIKDVAHPVVILVDGGDETAAAAAIDDSLSERAPLDGSLADETIIREYFDVTEDELSTGISLADAVLERVALLTING